MSLESRPPSVVRHRALPGITHVRLTWMAGGAAGVAALMIFIWPDRTAELRPAATPYVISRRALHIRRVATRNNSSIPPASNFDPVHEQVRAKLGRWHGLETGDTEAQA